MGRSDLISLVFRVRPEAAAPLPRWLGHAVYGAVLQRIAAQDPELAARIHRGEGPAGLTCSTLMGPWEGEGVTPAHDYRIRVTAYAEGVARALDPEGGGLWGVGDVFELAGACFRVEEVIAEGDPWAGRASYMGLVEEYLSRPKPWPRRMRLRFASPTAFRDGERWNPLPLPEAVFGHLVEKWNAFSPVRLPAALREMAAARIAVMRFDLSSRTARAPEGGVRVGCIGTVTYGVVGDDGYLRAVMGLLGTFARYAGVGILTTMGMGQVRIEAEEEPEES
ncbi:CRISPR system precrRNA processing endoribonuclease RAMP protein Cas6 [Thermoflexus sp.]|uniref:CRISPR system precrRNA processing endoribonuclease RAMP protein Cas6 n=1 Tax=Thermoflexus sp. TaxID=1969742 RepID=UPI002ADDB1A6|nr:CRISPR system precrRNA processing endoribonuclease RAMP protein Cas6 [Thermoflexus sp.]